MPEIKVTSLIRMRQRACTQTWVFFAIGITIEGAVAMFFLLRDHPSNSLGSIAFIVVSTSLGLALIAFSLTVSNERVAKLQAAEIAAENGWTEQTQAYLKAATAIKVSFNADPGLGKILDYATTKQHAEDALQK